MRCKFGATPMCKVNIWRSELKILRKIALECGLTEELKWSMPCYTFNGKNIFIISAFKHCACISFFKGSLLTDDFGFLEKPGSSSQATRFLKFTSAQQIVEKNDVIKTYIRQAMELEKSGKKVAFKKNPEPLPVELIQTFSKDESLMSAFFQLTPGRQRGYILYFSQPKQESTRYARIEKCIPKIMNGEGLNDQYKC